MEQITLDIIPNGSLPVLHASQYDDGRQWKVNLTENGEDYTLSNETIVLDVRKGDGCAVTCAVAIESGKKYVILTSTEQMCAVAGQNLAELQITKDGAIIGTLNFVIMVERDPLDAGIGSESEIHDLQHQVDSCVHTAFETIGASGLPYDNTGSGLTADNVQAAIDEVNEKASGLPSDVYTKEETDALLADKADKATLEADYYDKTEADALLEDKADASALGDYYTKSETDTKLSGKADKGSVYTKSQVNTLLNDKADKSDLDNYYTKSQANSLLNVKANKADVYDKDYMNGIFEQIDNAFTGVNTALGQKANSADVYNKTYIDTALSAKANANAVYTKAETDAKVDGLIDDDTTASNKTWSSNKISAELEALLPVNSASGSIANFTTSLALPLVSVKSAIVATGGGGTPSNPIAINGFSEAVITRSGANLWNEEWENGTINTTTGQNMNDSGKIRSKGYIKVNSSTKYRYVCTSIESGNDCLYYYDNNKNFLSFQIVQHTTAIDCEFTTPNNCGYVRFIAKGSTYNNNISINYPSTDTTYHAYTATTYTLALGQTVYGGEIVLTKKASGYAVKLRVTKAYYKTTGNEEFKQYTYAGKNGVWVENVLQYIGNRPPYVSNMSTYSMSTLYQSGSLWCGANSTNLYWIGVLDILEMTLEEFKVWIVNNPLEVAYELATPIEIDLTDASDIVALVGTNNVWSDTGDMEVRFKVGIQEYIDSKVGNNRSLSLSMSAPADDLRRDEPDEREER